MRISYALSFALVLVVVLLLMVLKNLGGSLSLPASGNMAKMYPALAGVDVPDPWPPKLDEVYPDLDLIDQSGREFKLSDYKGKVIILEPTGMNCPACQAFAGGHDYGAYQNNGLQGGVESFRKMFAVYAPSVTVPRDDLVFIELLLYDMKMGPPKPKNAALWAKHFGLRKADGYIVAVPSHDMRNSDTYNLIPGFQLIDKNFVLRADSTGHNPKNDLYKVLIPMVPMALGIGSAP